MTSEDIREMLETATPGPYYVGKHVIGPKGKSGFLRHLVELNWEDERGKADARLLAASWSLAAEVIRLREKAALRDEADAMMSARIAGLDAANALLFEALDAIRQYCNDTFSGPTSGPLDAEWYRGAVVESRNRARNAMEGRHWSDNGEGL